MDSPWGGVDRLSSWSFNCNERIRSNLDNQRLQHGISGRSLVASGSTIQSCEGIYTGRINGIRNYPAIPLLCRILGIITNTDLGDWLGNLFVEMATTETYPAIVYLYSGFMNLFVPSAGSKWLTEAPYLLSAAKELGVSATTTVLAFAYGDSTTNLIQPFWAIPILTVTGLRFGDVVGYTGLVAVVCFTISLIAMFLIPAQL